MARIVEVIGGYRSSALNCCEAAEVLGMSERHFRRLRDRYAANGTPAGAAPAPRHRSGA